MNFLVMLEGRERGERDSARAVISPQRGSNTGHLEMAPPVVRSGIKVSRGPVSEDVHALTRVDGRNRAYRRACRTLSAGNQRAVVAVVCWPIVHVATVNIERQGEVLNSLVQKDCPSGLVIGAVLFGACQGVVPIAF